ncbi:uncharacterized protein CLUP02_05234 [Colletotrichum lupini]|uniref:Uncharacterized protein n=1 Tax=Colletotrichum lupini TaxID=145971 RepID=A0A9Q8SLU8_9PEZI|nr:uncharacterized protein CLUP02_05234 [Colletotrichum lupini]UQC79754.1 hypothetical protein CLUP02_05234 [Colletotrichum lupini]
MAPRRQAALAAQANMAAVAAHEADDVMPVKVLKGSRNKQLKPIKIEKSSTVKASGKAPSSKNPPDDPKPSGSPGIPLVCLVCTSTPRFSDLSHLLTHLSSKGHLQTQNDVRIRATQDLAAADKVATYDKWYKDYGIERMLAERLKAKDEKARGFSRSGQGTSQTLKRKKARSTLVKREANDSMFTPPPTGRLLGQQQAITYYGDNDDLASASTPTDDAIEWGPDDLESARLKGTVWPGMGIFDAATPDQKKQRNQRKDASVLRKMELSSQAITTLEIVANLDLEFERTRDVYDAPSVEGSPVIKKSRRRQRRSGAAEEDGNASGVVVKEELADEAAHRASSALAMQLQNGLYKQEEVSELDSESLSEKFDVTSDIASTADGDSDTLDYAGMIELDESHKEIGGPDRGPNDQFFTVTDRVSDVFQGGSAAGTKASTTVKDEPRFDVRNRIPLRSMNANSNLSMASPTPAAKQLSRRTFTGKENNNGVQEHKMTSIDFYGVNNTHLNQAGMTTAINMDPNIFTGYSMPDMYHLNPVWGNPMLRAGHHGFNPINANHNHQQMMFSQQMPMMNTFGNGHHDHAQGSGVYQNGHGA